MIPYGHYTFICDFKKAFLEKQTIHLDMGISLLLTHLEKDKLAYLSRFRGTVEFQGYPYEIGGVIYPGKDPSKDKSVCAVQWGDLVKKEITK